MHASRGPLEPASPHLKSEVDIVCRIAEATLGDRHGIAWRRMREDYSVIRHAHLPGGARLRVLRGERATGRAASCCRTRRGTPATFATKSGKAEFVASPDRGAAGARRSPASCRRCAATTSSTPPSTASTTATAASRAAGGWSSCTPTTSPHLGFTDGDLVDIVTHWADDDSERMRRRSSGSSSYDTPRGSAAAYYPETNPLVPLDSTALEQQHPDLEVGHRQAATRRPWRDGWPRHRQPAFHRRVPQVRAATTPPVLTNII